MHHITQAFRQMALRPHLSVVVIAMLALGIGGTTAMFSLFYEILVRPLSVPQAERLVNLRSPGPNAGPSRVGTAIADVDAVFSYPMFRDLEREQTAFTDIAAQLDFQANLAYGSEAFAGRGTFVSGGYFGVLELAPALGRLIGRRDEPVAGESAVAVLSHEYWQGRFGGDPRIIGETLIVNGASLEIIGVAPEGFTGTIRGWQPHVFVPVTMRWRLQPEAPADEADRRSHWLYLFARLTPGLGTEQAAASINTLYSAILRDVEAPLVADFDDETRARFLEHRLLLEPGARGQSVIFAPASAPLALLVGVTALVLLIVCANVAHLLLARGASREAEMAIRASIGASRRTLAAQLLAESAALAALGGLLSLPVAAATLGLIGSMIPAQFALEVELQPAAVLYCASITLSTVLLFGLMPALRVSRAEPGHAIKGQSPLSAARGKARFGSTLTTSQIALSMALLVVAGLFARSLANIARVDLGIDVESVVSFGVAPGLNGYSGDRTIALYERIEEALAAQPGVAAAGGAMVPLLTNMMFSFQVSVEGFEATPGTDVRAGGNSVGPGFFDALSIPLLTGRALTEADEQGPQVAVVNESFVRKFGLGDDALGKRFGVGGASVPNVEIVGIVADAKHPSVKDEPPPQYFQPLGRIGSPWATFYVRGNIEPDALLRTIPRVIAEIDPNLPVTNLTTLERQVASNTFLDRLITLLSATFAGLATLLAATGLYGVLAYRVAQRARELGLRLALGAAPTDLRAMVLEQVARVAAVGVLVGLVLAVGLGRAAQSLLFGLSGLDPFVLCGAAALLFAVMLAAGFLPARRASSIAPMEALRHE